MRTGERGLPLFSPGERLVLAIVAAITVSVQLWGWWQSHRAARVLQEGTVRVAPTASDTESTDDPKPADAGEPGPLPAATAQSAQVTLPLAEGRSEVPETELMLPVPSRQTQPRSSPTSPSVPPVPASPRPTGGSSLPAAPEMVQMESVMSSSAPGLLSLNKASAVELEALPGIGPTLARRIIEFRDQHGPFRSVEELRDVPGIGEGRYRELRSRVTVP